MHVYQIPDSRYRRIVVAAAASGLSSCEWLDYVTAMALEVAAESYPGLGDELRRMDEQDAVMRMALT